MILTLALSPPINKYFKGEKISIAQCNNALIYPGIGLGVVIAQATHLSEGMLWEASKALSRFVSQTSDTKNALLPNFEDIHAISRCIALAVATKARQEGLAKISESIDLAEEIDRQFWYPEYVTYQYSESL